jgi:hypothetical protein
MTVAVPAGLATAAAAAAADLQPGKHNNSRKRQAADAEGFTPCRKLLCSALSDTHLLLVAAGDVSNVAFYAVLDSKFGCCLSSGPVGLQQPVPDNGRSSLQLLALPHGSGAQAALLVGSTVFLLHLKLPRADLAGLISRIAVSYSDTSSDQQQTAPPASAAVAPAVSHQSLLTAQQQLNLVDLAAALGDPDSQNDDPAAASSQQHGSCVLREVSVSTAASQLSGQSAADVSLAAAARDLSVVLSKQPIPAADLKQVSQELCAALQQQQQQILCSSGQQSAGRKGRHTQQQAQQHRTAAALWNSTSSSSLLLSQQLLAKGLAALAEAQEWAVLQQLHQQQPLQSLMACPRLLQSLAAAQQYQLLRQVVLAAQDIPVESLVLAMQLVLLQTGEVGPQAVEGDRIRQAAAGVVATAEGAVASGDVAAASAAIGVAHRAAAAVDGFTTRELLLHVLLVQAVDGVEATAALRELSTPAVLQLLKYLTKWVVKYSRQPLSGNQWQVMDPLLLAPSWSQTLDWLTVLLDATFTRLSMLPAAVQLLTQLQHLLQQEVGATSKLVSLKGAGDHLAMGAPLPAAAEAASSEYTLELLDLRVARRH